MEITWDFTKDFPEYLSVLIHSADLNETFFLRPGDEGKVYASRDRANKPPFFYYLKWFYDLHRRPVMVINGESDLHLKVEIPEQLIKEIKLKGLSVYLYEPIFIRAKNWFYPYTPGLHEGKLNSTEFETIRKFIKEYEIESEVNVYLCDGNVSRDDFALSDLYSFNVQWRDLFCLGYCIQSLKSIPREAEALYVEKTKKVICLNYRWEPHRALIVSHLLSFLTLNEMHLSYFHKHTLTHLQSRLGFRLVELSGWENLQYGFEKANEIAPITVDVSNPVAKLALHTALPNHDDVNQNVLLQTFELWKNYREAYIAVVTETRFQTPYAGFSEKTLLAMLNKNPFVVVSGPKTLALIRDLGFKTFSSVWDESYDEIEDHGLRMDAILKLTKDLLSKDMDELEKINIRLRDILEHNRNHALFGLPNEYIKMLSNAGYK